MIINGETGYSSRPISSFNVSGAFTQTTVSVVTSMMQSVSTSTPNSILDLGKMSSQIAPRVTMPPGSVIESLAYRGNFVQPTTDAVVDLANDGVIDWSFSSSPNFDPNLGRDVGPQIWLRLAVDSDRIEQGALFARPRLAFVNL